MGYMPMTDLIRELTPTAARLAGAVDQRNEAESHEILLSLNRQQLMALSVILAASVDLDRPLGVRTVQTPGSIVSRIAADVAERTGVTTKDIYNGNRDRDVTDARQIVCWVASAVGLKSTQIGRALNRDHSTVLHSIDRVTSTPILLSVARKVHADQQVTVP